MDPILAAVLLPYLVLFLVDAVRPARRVPPISRWWRLQGLAFFALYLGVATALATVWDGWLAEHRLLDATGLGIVGGTVVGLLLYELVGYVWHRAMHGVPFLWRWVHQMHHSAERVDVHGAAIFHPFDMAGWTFVASFSLLFLVGLEPYAVVAVSLIVNFLGLFQHANLRTPRWLGWIVQRPENHSIHHERGAHSMNYGSLVIWDVLFGTYVNPETWEGEAGFYDGASKRKLEMLFGRDVTVPPASRAAPASRDDLEAGALLAA